LGHTPAVIEFNQDVFKTILIAWIIVNSVSFRVDEHPLFHLLLGYLAACVRILSVIIIDLQ